MTENQVNKLMSDLMLALGEQASLRSEAEELRKGVLKGLIHGIRHPRADYVPVITDKLEKLEIKINNMYVRVVNYGDVAVDPMLRALKSHTWYKRMGAAYVLGVLKEPRAVQSLIDILEMDNEGSQDKEIAAVALGRIGDPLAMDSLTTSLLNNKSESVRSAAAMALDLLRSPSAVEPLIKALNDHNKEVRNTAVTALKNITGKSFIFGKTNPQKWQKWWNNKKR